MCTRTQGTWDTSRMPGRPAVRAKSEADQPGGDQESPSPPAYGLGTYAQGHIRMLVDARVCSTAAPRRDPERRQIATVRHVPAIDKPAKIGLSTT